MNSSRSSDPFETRAREIARELGLDPDTRVPHPTKEGRTMPVWTTFRDAVKDEIATAELERVKRVTTQPEQYRDAPLAIVGEHEDQTINQMRACMSFGNVTGGVLCADGHLGYAQPVGGVIAYKNQISVSGVGFDIACGNLAVKTDLRRHQIQDRLGDVVRQIRTNISFGVGRTNDQAVEAELFDWDSNWKGSGMRDYKDKARAQLGTVGSGNHYVDLMEDRRDGSVWVGIHFGSRGLGHTAATRYINAAGGKDGVHAEPVVLDVKSDLGEQYLQAMFLAGVYAYAGRQWVADEVCRILGAQVIDSVHNHHNYAWLEEHNGEQLYVVRKGATPAFPGQRGFIGGSMGDDAVIIEGRESQRSSELLYSTIHGAGRIFGRKEAIRRYTKAEMDAWLSMRGVTLVGGGVDESPMAYRRLDDVLPYHAETLSVLHILTPFAVFMAGDGVTDPFKD